MRVSVLLFCIFLIASCSNEIDVLEDAKEIPLVYAIVDPAQEAQYFRIERVFSEEGTNALDLASDPSQLYFEGLTVKIFRGQEEFTLTRVHGEDEGLPRDTNGVFATVPNVLYKISTEELEPKSGDELKLSIEGIYEDRAVTSTMTVIDQVFFLGRELSLVDKVKDIKWTGADDNSIYAFELEIDITEVNNLDMTTTEKTVVWNHGNAILDQQVSLIPEEFYQFLGGELEENENIKRFFGKVRYKIISGDTFIADRVRIAGANVGITSSSEIPTFTNMSEGLGIFASKHTLLTDGFPISGDTKLAIQESEFTKNLNFQ